MSEANTYTAKSPPRATAPAEAVPLPWRANALVISRVALIAADLLPWMVATAILYSIRALIWGTIPFHWVFWVQGAVWIIFRAAAGLYPPYGISQPEELRRSFRATMAAALTHLAMLLALQELAGWRLIDLGVWLLVVPIAWFARSLVKLLLIRERLFGLPYIVIGTGPKARRAIQEMKANVEMGFFPIAAFGDNPTLWGGQVEGVPVVGTVDEAHRYPLPSDVRSAIVALGHQEASREQLTEIVDRLARRFRTVHVFPDFSFVANLWTHSCPLGPYLLLETRNARFSARQRFLKRAFDLAVGIPAFLLALPVIAVCALLVKIFSPGPAFFAQEREGQGGRCIRIWKIRTMVPNAEQRLAEYLAKDPAAKFEWERFLKLRKDPRIIPVVGGFLRKFSLDELPQLWSVITGELTLVGPRVFAIWHVERFPTEFRELRHQVPPGLTGLWQVQYRNSGDLTVQERVDSYYIQNWSIWLDLWILLRTVRVVLVGSGAY